LAEGRLAALPSFDIGEQSLESWALHGAAREASVVKHVGECDPACMALAHDIGLASLPLRIERVELLIEPILG
jgi:hypothetical protein